MKHALTTLTLGCVLACFNTYTYSISEKEAAEQAHSGNFAAASASYKQLVANNPGSVPLRIELADALAKDRQWNQAIVEYEAVLKLYPDNIEATLGIATVKRWQGNIVGAKRASEQARVLAPQNAEAMLGLAAVYTLDHDFEQAAKHYEQAVKTWPEDKGVRVAASDFQHERRPRLYLLQENDLSFVSRQAGITAPFLAHEEIGFELQDETSLAPGNGNIKVYTRSDKKLLYTHYFGLNHSLDFSARSSIYEYNVLITGYTGINTYNEYRARYTVPITTEQTFSIRYAARPTILKLSQDQFTAHKVEAEFNSHWTPRLNTQLGVGWLRDLDSLATSTTQITDRSLIKLGVQVDVTNHLGLGAKLITNPDLDNSLNSTVLVDASYSLTDTWSTLGRLKLDNYKTGADQSSYYAAARFVPSNQWWSEFGIKYVTRGFNSGTFGLASVAYRF